MATKMSHSCPPYLLPPKDFYLSTEVKRCRIPFESGEGEEKVEGERLGEGGGKDHLFFPKPWLNKSLERSVFVILQKYG